MRPEYREENIPAFEYYAGLLSEATNLGCDLMEADRLNPKTTGPENIPQVAIFRHFIDLIDSIHLLVKAGSSDTPKVLLRAALESLIYLEYILSSNTINRSLAYMVNEYHKEISRIINMQKMTASLKEQALKEGHPFIEYFTEQEWTRAIAEKQKLLDDPLYAPIELLFQEAKKPKELGGKPRKDIKWYQLDGGASSVEQLANHLGHQKIYEIFYRKWSGAVHSSDLYLGRMTPSEDLQQTIMPGIRYPADVSIITEHALQLAWKACYIYMKGRIPETENIFLDRISRLKTNADNTSNQNSL